MKNAVKGLVFACLFCGLLPLISSGQAGQNFDPSDAIQPWPGNPYYWQYKGEPVLLLGGSDDDNVFNWPDRAKVKEHLELLAGEGGNYDRCTMSARDEGNARPHLTLENGKYDLEQWNPEFWDRFDFYLAQCNRLDIIVQVEIWATYDIAGTGSPFNPDNNVQRDLRRSTLDYSDTPQGGRQRRMFYSTVPALANDGIALKYQQAFVDEVLKHTLPYGNILYCIDNEYGWGMPEEWYEYWAAYLKEKAGEAGKQIQITEMNQIDWDLLLKLREGAALTEDDRERLGDGNPVLTVKHKKMYSNTGIFSFVDVGNGMGNSSPSEHWRHMQSIRNFISNEPHPMNNVKLYGADYNSFWPGQEGINKFWRNLLGGCASVRFHRPPGGQGLNEAARNSIRAARVFEKYLKPWECEPRMDLIADKGEHELYVMANGAEAIAALIPWKVTVNDWLKLKMERGNTYNIIWINISTGEWQEVVQGKRVANWIALSPPEFIHGGSGLVIFYKVPDG